jgi:hypothetical protein
MDDNARRRHEHDAEPASRRSDPFSLDAYLERRWAELAGRETMAEILAHAEARRPVGVPRETIAAAVRQDREERA